jgi:outer membrane protein OmpA-like peptidoglycan-associated protein
MRCTLLVFISFIISTSFANVNGTHLQNFNPTTNGLDFVTVQSAKTLASGQFNLGLYFDYAINSLPFFKAPGVPAGQNFDEPNDKLGTLHANIGFGIMENWEVGLSMPTVVTQSIDSSNQLGRFNETGVTEFRINTKYRLWSQGDMGVAVIGSVNFDRINNNPFNGNDSGPTWNAEAAFDYRISPEMLWAVNLGHRFADTGATIADTGTTPLGNQLLLSTALSYNYAPWESVFVFELFGSDFTEDPSISTDRKLHNLEALVAIKKSFFEKIAFVGGISREVYHGFASPDLRVFIGANWLLGPVNALEKPAPQTQVITTPVIEKTYEEVPSETIVLNSINFDTNKAQMTAASRVSMNGPLEQIRKNMSTIRVIIVEGHTDNVGTDAFNQTLSEKRAKAVREVLMKDLGLTENQVQAQGFGESKPIDTNNSDAGRRKNRRVELKIYRSK